MREHGVALRREQEEAADGRERDHGDVVHSRVRRRRGLSRPRRRRRGRSGAHSRRVLAFTGIQMRRGEFVGVALVVVQLQAHAVVDLVVLEGNVVFVHGVPLLDAQLLRSRASLRCEQFLQVTDSIVRVAFDANLLTEAVVAYTARASTGGARASRACEVGAIVVRSAYTSIIAPPPPCARRPPGQIIKSVGGRPVFF